MLRSSYRFGSTLFLQFDELIKLNQTAPLQKPYYHHSRFLKNALKNAQLMAPNISIPRYFRANYREQSYPRNIFLHLYLTFIRQNNISKYY